MIYRIILSFLGIGARLLLIIKTKSVVDFTGGNGWIEETFGSGQTYNFYKVLGIVVIFGFFLYLIGDLDSIIRFFVKLFFP